MSSTKEICLTLLTPYLPNTSLLQTLTFEELSVSGIVLTAFQ